MFTGCRLRMVTESGILSPDGITLRRILSGKQLVKAADSVAANLSEGFGRYHYRRIKISAIIPWLLI
jgi:hypothetical protein